MKASGKEDKMHLPGNRPLVLSSLRFLRPPRCWCRSFPACGGWTTLPWVLEQLRTPFPGSAWRYPSPHS